MRWIFALTLLAPQLAWAGDLRVEDAWIPAAPPAAKVHAAYMSLFNDGAAPLSILSVQAAGYGAVHMHATTEKAGISTMMPVHQIDIPAGAEAILAPGGMHLMLMAPEGPQVEGARVLLTFELLGGAVAQAFATVKARDAGS